MVLLPLPDGALNIISFPNISIFKVVVIMAHKSHKSYKPYKPYKPYKSY